MFFDRVCQWLKSFADMVGAKLTHCPWCEKELVEVNNVVEEPKKKTKDIYLTDDKKLIVKMIRQAIKDDQQLRGYVEEGLKRGELEWGFRLIEDSGFYFLFVGRAAPDITYEIDEEMIAMFEIPENFVACVNMEWLAAHELCLKWVKEKNYSQNDTGDSQ